MFSNNRVLIERITFIISARADLNFQLFSTSRYDTAVNDIESFKADTVIIDARDCGTEKFLFDFCKTIAKVSTVSKCFLLIDEQEDNKQLAMKMQSEHDIDDYIIYEYSLEDLFCKLKE